MKNEIIEISEILVDEDITVLMRKTARYGELYAVWEHWLWEGIEGFSLIFRKDDVTDCSDADLLSMVADHSAGSTPNVSRKNEHFVFVNYGF